jgi:hypothetical protein
MNGARAMYFEEKDFGLMMPAMELKEMPRNHGGIGC